MTPMLLRGVSRPLPSFLSLSFLDFAIRLFVRHVRSEVGHMAALIVASSFAYILANNDVRMDAILTASIIFATWQLVAWVDNKNILHAVGAALGLALGFCTKGHIAVFTPAVGVFFYILYNVVLCRVMSLSFLLSAQVF